MDLSFCDSCQQESTSLNKGRVEVQGKPPEAMRPGVVYTYGPWVRNFGVCDGCLEKLKVLVTFDPAKVKAAA